MLISSHWANQCYVCHASQRFPFVYSENLIKEWLATGKRIDQKGHIWIPKEKLVVPANRFIDSNYERLNFYSTLSILAKNISFNGGSKDDLKNLKRLINQGMREIPIFEEHWRDGLAILDASFEERMLRIKSFQASLERPFLYLHLRNGLKYEFEAQSQVEVGKVLLFFGGFSRTSKVNFSFLNQSFDGQNYRGKFLGTHHLKKPQLWKADYFIDTFGELKRLTPTDSILTSTMINMAGFLARGIYKDLDNLAGKKTIFLGRNRVIKKNKLELKMTMEFGEVLLKNNQPLLPVNYKLSEVGDDRGDRLNLSGKGKVVLSVDGLMQEMDSRVRFQLKLLKIGLINGISKDYIRLQKISR